MAEAGYKRPAPLARDAGVSPSTISRLVYGGVDRPDPDTLGLLAAALVRARGPEDPEEQAKAIQDKHDELFRAAGYRVAEMQLREIHPLARELDQMVGEGTPLDAADVAYLSDMVERLVKPYRAKVRRRVV